MVALFRDTMRELARSRNYAGRTHIEIVRYLNHVRETLGIPARSPRRKLIQEKFSELFPLLNFQAAKGRDCKRFVYVRDRFGKQEPFVLLRLEENP